MNTEMCFFCVLVVKATINYFFEIVVPQILEYFKENKNNQKGE